MSKDVKIELIYFKNSRDISLEFGLHGNYPVRLLASDCDGFESFFRTFKRAISRSEIIIIIGGYTQKEYLPGLIARSIGKAPIVPDYKEHGVIAETKYAIPESSMPLAPKSKRFGGFIIESGPQTIISLTDDKKIRLDVTNEIITKYIEEHHKAWGNYKPSPASETSLQIEESLPITEPEAQTTDTEALSTNKPEEITRFENISSSSFVIVEEFEDISSSSEFHETETKTEAETEIQAEIEEQNHNIEEEPTEESLSEVNNDEPLVENDDISIITKKYKNNDKPAKFLNLQVDDIFYSNTEKKPMKTVPQRHYIRIISIILVILTIIGTLTITFIEEKRAVSTLLPKKDYYTTMLEMFTGFGDDLDSAFSALREHNSSINSWITNRNGLNHPVVAYNVNDYKEYYLTHLPDGSVSTAGMVFSSCETYAEDFTHNLVLYGNGTEGIGVFQSVVEYFQINDLSKLNTITLTNKFGRTDWKVFSIFTEGETNGFVYDNSDFDNDLKYTAYVNQLLNLNRTQNEPSLSKADASVLLLVAIAGGKRYIAAAAPIDTVNYGSIVNDTSSEASSSEPENKPIINVNDENLELNGKEDNESEYEQQPIDPENIVVLPPVSKPQDSSSQPPVSSTISSSAASSSNISNSSSKPSSSVISSSTISSSVISSSSSLISSSTSSTTISSAQSSSQTSSTTTPNVDPMYTWDVILYVKKDGSIINGSASDIVAKIVEAEMGSGYNIEALKAQAIAAYAWLLNNGALNYSTAPSGVPMKVALSRSIEAVQAVKGTLITYNNKVASTFYYAYSAGKTANPQDIWGGTAYPYLQSVDCSVDESISNFQTSKTYTSHEIKSKIQTRCNIDVSTLPKEDWIKPIQYDNNDLYCVYVEIGGVKYKGQFVRATLLEYEIRSSAYTIDYDAENDTFTITCKGWGHGVGMSQRAANSYAGQGWTAEQILSHFYPGTTLIKY